MKSLFDSGKAESSAPLVPGPASDRSVMSTREHGQQCFKAPKLSSQSLDLGLRLPEPRLLYRLQVSAAVASRLGYVGKMHRLS